MGAVAVTVWPDRCVRLLPGGGGGVFDGGLVAAWPEFEIDDDGTTHLRLGLRAPEREPLQVGSVYLIGLSGPRVGGPVFEIRGVAEPAPPATEGG